MLGSRISSQHCQLLLQQARVAPMRWLDIEPALVARHYNRRAFEVRHRLPQHPDFTLEALRSLCRRLPAADVYRRQGAVPADAHFDSSLQDFRCPLTVDETFDRLVADRLYIAIYNPEQDPHYRGVIEGLLGEIALATERHERCINWYSTYLFISAAGSLTPYHMDREMNFLLQIRGTKTARLWDPQDDEVMTPRQRDHLFSWADDARPEYRPELDAKARVFHLVPGTGVHHPFIAPHLVSTDSELSISLAITFRTPRSDTWTAAHVFNENLRRRFGWTFGRVGSLPLLDHMKAMALRLARRVRHRGAAGESESS